jgi:hypothetical protein
MSPAEVSRRTLMTSLREELAGTETEGMCQRRLLRRACLYLRLIIIK